MQNAIKARALPNRGASFTRFETCTISRSKPVPKMVRRIATLQRTNQNCIVETDRWQQNRWAVKALDAVNAIRFQELAELFDDVPRAPTKTQAAVSISKFASKLWSPDDLEVLVDLLVTITQDMQQKGTSPLIQTVASKLRTWSWCLVRFTTVDVSMIWGFNGLLLAIALCFRSNGGLLCQ